MLNKADYAYENKHHIMMSTLKDIAQVSVMRDVTNEIYTLNDCI